MLSTSRPVGAKQQHNYMEVEPADDTPEAELESETSQEYPESEDDEAQGGQHQNGRAQTMYHAPRSDCDTANSTRSLYDSDINYTYINGRRYCENYYLPNDEQEQERWQMMHQMYLHLFDNCLTTVPLTVEPKRILDIGCGTGDWVLDMATIYPDAEIIGIDVAPVQPTLVPQTVFFEIDDAELEGGWTFTSPFDLIHIRSMSGAFHSWPLVYTEAFKHLNPGGWIEVLDFDDHDALIDFFKDEPIIADWHLTIVAAMEKAGRPLTASHLNERILTDLGFVDVDCRSWELKMGNWGEEVGVSTMLLNMMLAALEAMSLRPLVEFAGWELEDVEKVCREVEEASRRTAGRKQKATGCALKVKVLRGRRPEEGSVKVNGNGNGFLKPEEKDTDGESVATLTKENTKTNGH